MGNIGRDKDRQKLEKRWKLKKKIIVRVRNAFFEGNYWRYGNMDLKGGSCYLFVDLNPDQKTQ